MCVCVCARSSDKTLSHKHYDRKDLPISHMNNMSTSSKATEIAVTVAAVAAAAAAVAKLQYKRRSHVSFWIFSSTLFMKNIH